MRIVNLGGKAQDTKVVIDGKDQTVDMNITEIDIHISSKRDSGATIKTFSPFFDIEVSSATIIYDIYNMPIDNLVEHFEKVREELNNRDTKDRY